MNGYVCFYKGKRFECHADTTMKARELAEAHFKAGKSQRHMISVILAEKSGEQVVHDPAIL
jgi:hypothetical protein